MTVRMIAIVAVLGSLLTTATPALAAPEPDRPGGLDPRLAATKVEKWDPDAKIPELTIPGTGMKVKPFSTLEPAGPTALPGFENARVNTLYADGTGAAIRKADGVKLAEEPYYCQTIMGGTNSIREEPHYPPDPGQPTAQFAQVLYLGEVICNVYLPYMAGMAGLIDRTPGYNGRTLSTGQPFTYTDWYRGVSTGGVEISGEAMDGARQAEIAFDLYLQAPGGVKWGNCAPGPGQRILFCSGVGTSMLHVQLGLGVFNTGLRPPIARYVALGDSYASGTGIGNYTVPGPPMCRRSYLSYPYQVAGMRIPSGTQVYPASHACHGAKIQDMYTPQPDLFGQGETNQLSYLNPQTTRIVTLSIGGNDLQFSPKLKRCMFEADCGVGPNVPLLTVDELRSVQGRLSTLYREILANRIRQDGILVVFNYPAIFPPLGQAWSWCFGQGLISPAEVGQIQQAWTEARLMVANAVTAVGSPRIRLVDMYDAFAGHYICSGSPWANGVTTDVEDSFHPNGAGHQAYKNKFVQAIGLRP